MVCLVILFFFFKQKTAYEMRISDWSSDVCSSDLLEFPWSFKNTPESRERLVALFNAFDAYPKALEVRHATFQDAAFTDFLAEHEIGRASCRERVCQYV